MKKWVRLIHIFEHMASYLKQIIRPSCCQCICSDQIALREHNFQPKNLENYLCLLWNTNSHISKFSFHVLNREHNWEINLIFHLVNIYSLSFFLSCRAVSVSIQPESINLVPYFFVFRAIYVVLSLPVNLYIASLMGTFTLSLVCTFLPSRAQVFDLRLSIYLSICLPSLYLSIKISIHPSIRISHSLSLHMHTDGHTQVSTKKEFPEN